MATKPRRKKIQLREGPIRTDLLPIPNLEECRYELFEMYPTGDGGGWTSNELPEEFWNELRDLLYRYGGLDCDGDARLEANIVDRKTHMPFHFAPIPYRDNDRTEIEDGDPRRLSLCLMNLGIAHNTLDREMRIWMDGQRTRRKK